MRRMAWRALGMGLALVAGIATWSDAQAQSSVESFYKGKTINMVVGYTSGGGFDIYARLLGRHMGRYIPGGPSFVTQNMPGAGGMKSGQYLYSIAPKDGLTMATFGRGVVMAPVFGHEAIDATKFTWIGSMTADVTVCLSRYTSQIKTWSDVMTKQYIVGGDGATNYTDMFARMIKNVFKADVKLVTGYPGGSEIRLAMERGEIDGTCGVSYESYKNTYGDNLRESKVNILVQTAVKSDPRLAGVPRIIDSITDPEQLQTVKLILGPDMARPFAAPPEIPADRKTALRGAFDKVMLDAELLAEAKKLNVNIDPTPGAEIDKMIGELYATSPAIVEKAKAAIAE